MRGLLATKAALRPKLKRSYLPPPPTIELGIFNRPPKLSKLTASLPAAIVLRAIVAAVEWAAAHSVVRRRRIVVKKAWADPALLVGPSDPHTPWILR